MDIAGHETEGMEHDAEAFDGRHKVRAPERQKIDGPDTLDLKAGDSYEVRFK